MMQASGGVRKLLGCLSGSVKQAARRVSHCLRYDPYMRPSYSQEGEDIILDKLFGQQAKGFYIDVGAHHPMRFSNTYSFYRRGWCGINIDAMPLSMQAFKKSRPRDINLEMAILKERGSLKYYQFNEPALNGFSVNLSEQRNGLGSFKVIGVVEMEGVPLVEVLEKYMPANIRQIDFMSVDVEGLDLEVLQSNDWERFRPKVILVELLSSSLSSISSDPVYIFLAEHDYSVFAKAVQTVFFASREFMAEQGLRP